MSDGNNSSKNATLLSCKTVIRTKDYDASKNFYIQILNLSVVEEYNDNNGSRGIIIRIGAEDSNAFLEISEIKPVHDYYQAQFSTDFESNKVGIQIRTEDVFHWASILNRKWETRGPILRPWGSYYLYLKDPDGLQIIIYQENNNKQ